eukprot:7015104-Prymnesium_polylepis.1
MRWLVRRRPAATGDHDLTQETQHAQRSTDACRGVSMASQRAYQAVCQVQDEAGVASHKQQHAETRGLRWAARWRAGTTNQAATEA